MFDSNCGGLTVVSTVGMRISDLDMRLLWGMRCATPFIHQRVVTHYVVVLSVDSPGVGREGSIATGAAQHDEEGGIQNITHSYQVKGDSTSGRLGDWTQVYRSTVYG
jgi:hypothetical protein